MLEILLVFLHLYLHNYNHNNFLINNNNLQQQQQQLQQPSTTTAIQAVVGVQQYFGTLTPNDKLDLCCRKQGVSSVCQTICNFDTFTDKSLVHAVISNQCPGPQLGQAFECATSKVDHSDCCRRSNVHLHNNGECLLNCFIRNCGFVILR